MTKNEFLRELARALDPLRREERVRSLTYYREMIEDLMEEGLAEEEAVARLEPIPVIADGIIADAAARGGLRRRGGALRTGLIIVGSPVWLPLLLAFAAVALALYACAWAVVVSFFAAALGLAAGALAGVAGLVIFAGSNLASGVFALGAGLICAALGIVFFIPTVLAARVLARSAGGWFSRLWGKIFNRGGETA